LSSIEPSSHRICATVVTFQPDLSQLQRLIAALASQVDQFVVVDNTPEADRSAELVKLVAAHGGALLAVGRNLGLAEGQNRGVAWARDRGFSHVLLMDQDSVPAPDMVRSLLRGLRDANRLARPVAAVGAAFIDPRIPETPYFLKLGPLGLQRVRCRQEGCEVVEVDVLIASGTLLPVSSLERVGPMDRDLFIDYVDTDWCFRALAQGMRIYGVCAACFEHRLGDRAIRLWVGGFRRVGLHQPLRLYYIFRNALLIYRRPHAPRHWIASDIVRLMRMAVFYTLGVRPRASYVRMMLQGLRDGWQGRSGPFAK
jgi:rhamnosyltransferase